MGNLGQEAAAALLVMHTELEPYVKQAKATHANVLVDIAKKLQRLQTRRTKLRKDLRQVDADIRRAKKELKGLAQLIGKGKE